MKKIKRIMQEERWEWNIYNQTFIIARSHDNNRKKLEEGKEHQRKACIIKTKMSLFMKSSNYLSTNRLVKVYFSNKVTFQNVL